MKSIIFVLCLGSVCIFTAANGQKNKDFEGRISYQNKYESNVTGMENTMLASMMGQKWDYYINRDGAYLFEMNGAHIQKQYYNPEEYKLYVKFTKSDTLSWIDVREDVNEVINHELVKTDLFVLGYRCNALILKTSRGTETYYFNRNIKATPETFQKHKFLNMAYVLKHTESIPLKIVLENEEMDFTSTATEIEEMEFEDDFFDIPDAPARPSTF
jgi:hypothetical protein